MLGRLPEEIANASDVEVQTVLAFLRKEPHPLERIVDLLQDLCEMVAGKLGGKAPPRPDPWGERKAAAVAYRGRQIAAALGRKKGDRS